LFCGIKVELSEILPGVNFPGEKLWGKVQTGGIPFVTGNPKAARNNGYLFPCGTFSVSVIFPKDFTGLFL